MEVALWNNRKNKDIDAPSIKLRFGNVSNQKILQQSPIRIAWNRNQQRSSSGLTKRSIMLNWFPFIQMNSAGYLSGKLTWLSDFQTVQRGEFAVKVQKYLQKLNAVANADAMTISTITELKWLNEPVSSALSLNRRRLRISHLDSKASPLIQVPWFLHQYKYWPGPRDSIP